MKTALHEDDETSFEVAVTSPATEHSGVHVRMLTPGENIAGKYVIHGKLGEGGFAVVYDAEHLGLDRRVAIKVVHLHEETPPSLLERSRREARISALVRHPNVLEVFDTGHLDDGSPYLVMERLEGETLSECIARGPLPFERVVEVAQKLASALEAISARNVVHRDIKPDNVMFHRTEDGKVVVKLVDFGISKRMDAEKDTRLTWTGSLLGTPYYMSPEQVRGDELDVRADLYSLGCVLYEALTGEVPHDRESLAELLVATLNDDIRPIHTLRLDCPPELERLVMRALERSRDARYESAAAMRAAFDAYAAAHEATTRESRLSSGVVAIEARDSGVPLLGVGSSASRVTRALSRSRPAQAALGVASLCVLFGVLGLRSDEPDAHPQIAQASVLPVVEPRAVETAPLPAPEPIQTADASEQTELAPPVEEPSTTAATEERTPRKARREPAKAQNTAALESARVFAANTVAQQASQRVLDEALAAYTLGRYDSAQQLYRKAVQLAPGNPAAWRGLGLVAARRGDHGEARTALSRYLALSPDAADAPTIKRRIAALPLSG